MVLAAVWLVEVVVSTTPSHVHGGGVLGPLETLTLIPSRVIFGHQFWRLLTYAPLHDPSSIASVLWTVLSLWWFGSPLERVLGPRRVLAIVAVSALLGGLLTLVAGLLDTPILMAQTLGMTGPCYALAVAWGLQRGSETFSLFGAVTLDGRRFAWITIALAAVAVAVQRTGADVTGLGGALAGGLLSLVHTRRPLQPVPQRARSGRLRAIDGGRDKKKEWLN